MATRIEEPLIPQTEVGVNLAKVVRDAWLATSALEEDVTPTTREEAFILVLSEMLRGRSSDTRNADVSGTSVLNPQSQDAPEDLYSTPELRKDGISDYLQIEEEGVEALFSVHQREPMVQVDPSALSVSIRVALRELALLEIAGRTAVGLDTNQAHIQSTADRYQACDGQTYLARLLAGDDLSFLGRPSDGERLVRLTGSGVVSVRTLAQRILAT